MLLTLCICSTLCCSADSPPSMRTYRQASDASAAVAVGEDTFVVADDENNIIRLYKTSGPDLPVYSYDLSEFLNINSEHPEADIEGATRIGSRIYWITSHGRNKDGKPRPNRYRFFATDVLEQNGRITIQPVGDPYTNLVDHLISDKNTRNMGLDKATRLSADLSKKQREKLAPKEEGLNIEALCASPDGKTMYIGFRNPLIKDKTTGQLCALLVPMLNADLVVKQGDMPLFDQPILWDFDELGIRSMEYSRFHKAYFVIAGEVDSTKRFALYRWSGLINEKTTLVKELSLSNFTPEALIPFDNSNRLLLLSDDGTISVKVAGPHECISENEYNKDTGACQNKYLLDPNNKTFRALWLTP